MQIADIYKRFQIPPNLQEHMLRVYGIVEFIGKHWKGVNDVDWNLTKNMALLHDLGNVVKFDFDRYPEFLGSEQVNTEYWKKVQHQMIQKYGTDDNEATSKILKEIGIDQKIIDIIFSKRFSNSIKTENSDNWPLKILYYSDLRVLPLRIGTLEERIADIRKRYNSEYASRPDFEDLVNATKNIEKQIQENLDISVNDISDETVHLQPFEALRYQYI